MSRRRSEIMNTMLQIRNSNVEKAVLALTTDPQFEHGKQGRGGGECVEGGDEVWWW